MATKTLTQIFNEVAEAIQNKKGSSTPISAEDFGTEITNLPSGGSEDPNLLIIPYDSTVVLHLDKLKQYLPTEILNTQLTYYNYEGEQYCLAAQFSDELAGPINIRFSQVAEDTSSYYSTRAIEINTYDINTETDLLSSVIFRFSSESSREITDISVSDHMTIGDLIDNIIIANSSTNVLLDYDTSAWSSDDIISISGLNVTIICEGESSYDTKCIAANKLIPNAQLKEIFTIAEE